MSSSNGSVDMRSLLKRLETATCKLENLVGVTGSSPTESSAGPSPTERAAGGNAKTSKESKSAVPALETTSGTTSSPDDGDVSSAVRELDDFIRTKITPWIETTRKLGDSKLDDQANLVHEAFLVHRDFIVVAPKSQRPATTSDSQCFACFGAIVSKAADQAAEQRPSVLNNHFRLLADSLQALSWVVNDAPADFVTSVVGDARVWENKIRMAHKGEESHVTFVDGSFAIFNGLIGYVKKNFPKSLNWNGSGRPFSEAYTELLAAKKNGDVKKAAPAAAAVAPPNMKSLLSDIKQGPTSVRSQAPASPVARSKSPLPPPHTKPKPVGMRGKKPKRIETNAQKKQITIEFVESEQEPIKVEVPFGYSVLISECTNASVFLKGKANAVSVTGCKKLSLLVETVVSGVDVVNSKSLQFQAEKSVSALQLDRVDCAEIYLNKSDSEATIMSSGSNGINVVVVDVADQDSETVEYPVPEQLITRFENGRLVTEVYNHNA